MSVSVSDMRGEKRVRVKDNQRMKKQAPGKPAQVAAAQGVMEPLIDLKYCIIEKNDKIYR